MHLLLAHAALAFCSSYEVNFSLIDFALQLPPPGTNVWATGLMCNCFSDGTETCLLSICFPMVLHGRNAETSLSKLNGQASNECFNAALTWMAASIFGLHWAVQLGTRRKVREIYGISEAESCCGSDVVTALCCPVYDLVQVSRQLRFQPPALKE
jgi:Cys-rich protein (TIGR01571 family)